MPSFAISPEARLTAGVLLLTIPLIEFGGTYLLRIVRGRVAVTPFQASFARAGHAHAGVLVILSLICVVLADATRLEGLALTIARSGIPLAAILISAGFFLSSAHSGATGPNRLIVLLYAGIVSLAAGALTLGVGLLTV
jgi:hypothetical protein